MSRLSPSNTRSSSDYLPELTIGLAGTALSAGAAVCGVTTEAAFSGIVFGGVAVISGELVLGSPVRRGVKKAWDQALDKAEASVVHTYRAVRHPVKTSRAAWIAVANKVEDIRIAHEARWQPAFEPHKERRTRIGVAGYSTYTIHPTLGARR